MILHLKSIFHMRASLILITSLFLLACACKSGISHDPCSAITFTPSGRYINTTVLDKCPGQMPGDVPHFCFELTFKGKDSVEVDNGFEKYGLPYSKDTDGCRFKIAGASLFGDMYFTIAADSSLQLADSAWTKLSSFTTFKKVKGADGTDLSFEFALNDCAIGGQYALKTKGVPAPHNVSFYPNGQINGFKPFLGYALCYAGDCMEETDPYAQTIDLMDERGNVVTFVMKAIEGKKAIELYSIGDPIPDMKGGRSIGPLVYELHTE